MANKHNLHIKIDIRIKQQLQILLQKSGKLSLSGLVRSLISQFRCSLMYHYFHGDEQQSQYCLIDQDPTVSRCSLHIYLTEAEYRWLKLIHQDLNFFSLAQIVRWLLRVALQLLNQGTSVMWQEWQKMVRYWKKMKKIIHSRMKKIVQLLPFCKLDLDNISWISIYNLGYAPIREVFIKT